MIAEHELDYIDPIRLSNVNNDRLIQCQSLFTLTLFPHTLFPENCIRAFPFTSVADICNIIASTV